MKKGIFRCIFIICASCLVACGHQPEELDTYTRDALVQQHEQEDVNNNQDENLKSVDKKQAEEKKEQDGTEKDTQVTQKVPPSTAQNNSSLNTSPPVVNEAPVENDRIAEVTISIDTKTLLNNMDKVEQNKKAYVPRDGWILAPISVKIQEGDNVFDVLSRVTRERRIHMEYQGADQNVYSSVYIQGIGQLYEFDCGELSGWMYTINGAYVSQGASNIMAEDGMRIEWRYTCDLGRDLGL